MPHFITCNAFIGRAYAKVLAGFLRDSVQPGAVTPLDPTQPLYVVELGAGSGKFGFFMLRALMELRATCPFPLDKVVYVMTDFTKQNFDFWTEHEGLREVVERGQLDFALFDAVQDESITLHRAGRSPAPRLRMSLLKSVQAGGSEPVRQVPQGRPAPGCKPWRRPHPAPRSSPRP